MKRKRFFLRTYLLLLMLAFIPNIRAASEASTRQSYQCKIYSCYLSSNMKGWLATLKQMERDYSTSRNDSLLVEIIKAQYGYIAWAIHDERNEEASAILTSALNNVDGYLGRHPKNAEVIALKSSLIGFKIALSPIKGTVLGTKTISLINEAMDLAPKNPWVVLEKANAELYTPKFFGGNPTAALEHYKYTTGMLSKQDNSCSWGYLNAYVNMAYCYIKLNRYDDAMKVYQKLITIAPNFQLVQRELIPNLNKKIQKEKL